ncbi:hypothetical protein IHV10_22240 [Fictibacillus sp. 5RED26]|uniref:AimR family lysis-lysogeny pheromone receptor n=1 Tax=Fictibacillus sp. 5RED26 TaxID=2745876 RepID=UPI0018CF20A8|nr:AimR family lysis-lysogeny pheromone receptor [Fictibacillus sp. 5RED26]MBH0159093.1 hypothetical protein [Fictibacillus sp. 5RED26]
METVKTMKELMERIHEDQKKRGIVDLRIAELLNLTAGAVSQYYSGTSEIFYPNFVKLVDFIYSEKNEFEIRNKMLSSFCRLTKRKQNLRTALEYSDRQGNYDLLGELVENEKKSINGANRETARVYDLIYNRETKQVKGKKLLDDLNQLLLKKNIKSLEMEILTKIINMYAIYDMQEYDGMFKVTDDLNKAVGDIKNDFIREAFQYRVDEIYAYSFLYSNKPQEAREVVQKMLKAEKKSWGATFCSQAAYYVIGQSYIFESADKSIKYLNAAISEINKYPFGSTHPFQEKKKNIQNTLDFVKIFWDRNLETLNPEHKAEQAFLYYKRGNVDEADKLIEEIKNKEGILTPFQLYLSACIKNDGDLMIESWRAYEKKGDKFYANLPMMKLGMLNPKIN